MRRSKKIILLLVLCIMLILGISLSAYAANRYNINGKSVSYTDFSSSPNECWTYANNLYRKIWGHNFTNSFSDNENMLRNLSDSEITLTPEHLKTYITVAKLGSVIRICDSQYLHIASDGWGHSQIIVQKDNNGFTVLQGGLSASPYKNERYYTWNQYCSSWKYQYIKYIKWPGAPAYNGDTTAPTISDVKITNKTNSGYTVHCIVRDNNALSHVLFPTWTPWNNGQDDITWDRADVAGGAWELNYRVNTSAHKNEVNCWYVTHIYVYDAAGNCTNVSAGDVFVDATGPVISNYKVTNKTSKGFNVSCTVTDNKKLSYVDFLVWPNANGDWSPAYHRATLSGNTASYYVKVSEHHNFYGNYAVHVQAYDDSGNMTYGQFDWIKVEKAKSCTHTYKTTVTPAKTTRNGSIVKACTKCGKVASKKTIYAIKTIQLSSVNFVYNGKARKPSVIVKDSKGNRISSSNYIIRYVEDSLTKNVGTYGLLVGFKNNYTGFVTKQYNIIPKGTTISGITGRKNGFTVSIRKQATQTSGYQISYSTNRTFKNCKYKNISSNKVTKLTVSNLGRRKAYYIRVRTYKRVDGKVYYSGWSSAKRIVTK